MYSYAGNNPLTTIDSDGHYYCAPDTTSTTNDSVTVTAGACHYEWSDITRFFGNIAQQTANVLSSAAQQIGHIMNTPGGPGCMAAAATAGAGTGILAGGGVGAAGIVGGPTVLITEPTGATIGGIGGGLTGIGLAMSACPGGAANGGGGSGGGGVRPLQKGGNSISNATAKALNDATGKNLPAREWGRAVEELKQSEGLPPNSHGTIMSNGDYISANGVHLGNLTHYLP